MTEENNEVKAENSEVVAQTPPTTPETLSPLPDEIKKFNWGAFFLTWIWGLGNESYLTFFVFLVYGVSYISNAMGLFLPLCLAFNIFCGIKGNEWAWRNKNWKDTQAFNQTQERWALGGALFFIIARALGILLVVLFIALIFLLIYPMGNMSKFEDWVTVGKKGVHTFTKYSVESTLDGTNMSKINNSNELAREIASGFNTKSIGNVVYVSSNGRIILKVYKDGECSLEKKNCHVELGSSRGEEKMSGYKFYIDENKKLVPVEEVVKKSP